MKNWNGTAPGRGRCQGGSLEGATARHQVFEMAIEYLKSPLSYAAVAVIGALAVVHPGGEATVKHYPDGHVEIASYFDIDLNMIDPVSRVSQRILPGRVTTASTAFDAIIDDVKAI